MGASSWYARARSTSEVHVGESPEGPTSERLTVEAYQSTIGDYLIYLFHVATYEFARGFVSGRRTLDFGCGTGYGTHSLADDAATVTGVDISSAAIAHARQHFKAPGLDFRVIDPVPTKPLPFADGSFDVVLSFQVIEHISEVDAYLGEIRRVLSPGGVFVCATPDRTTRLFRGQRPWNVYHVVEYTPLELETMLSVFFPEVDILGMTAPDDLLRHELRRVRRLRVMTLPVTFPHVPEKVRLKGLEFLKKLQARRGGAAETQTGEPHSFGHEVIRIESGALPSVNIVAVARRD